MTATIKPRPLRVWFYVSPDVDDAPGSLPGLSTDDTGWVLEAHTKVEGDRTEQAAYLARTVQQAGIDILEAFDPILTMQEISRLYDKADRTTVNMLFLAPTEHPPVREGHTVLLSEATRWVQKEIGIIPSDRHLPQYEIDEFNQGIYLTSLDPSDVGVSV